MKRIAQVLSAVALVGTLLPSCLFLFDRLSLAGTQQWMLAAAVLWFVATPLWMEHSTGS